jgi:AcrR family transcriptional regulator
MALTVRTKKEVVTEFRCTEILRAARAVFAEKGYQAATVDEIAEIAEVSKGTIYLYFPSKFEVFVATLRQGVLEMQERGAENMAAVKTAGGKIRAFMRSRLEYGEQNRDFFRIYFTEFSNVLLQPSSTRQEFQDLYHRQARVLEGVIREGIKAGEIRNLDARRAAYLIYEVTRSAIAHRIQGWDDCSVEQSEETLFDLVWRGVTCN